MTGDNESGNCGSSIETLRMDIIGNRFFTDALGVANLDIAALHIVQQAAEQFDLSDLETIVVCKEEKFRKAVKRLVNGAEQDGEEYDAIPDELAGVRVTGYWRLASVNESSYEEMDAFDKAPSGLQRAAYQVSALDANRDEMAALAKSNEEVEEDDSLARDGIEKVPDVEADAVYIVPDGGSDNDVAGIAEAAMANGVSHVRFDNAEDLGLIDREAIDAYAEEQNGGVTEEDTDDVPEFGGEDDSDPVEEIEGEDLPVEAPEL